MSTPEERIVILEQTTSEYRPVLHNFAYELSMVKGLILTQTDITQQLRQDMNEVKQRFDRMDTRFDQVDTRLDRMELLLTHIIERLPKPAE